MNPSTSVTYDDANPSATIRPEPTDTTDVRAEVALAASRVELTFSETLGSGAMGVVRLANQPSLDRTVAVKSLRNGSAEGYQRLLREARVTGALQHPNIVPVYDIVVDGEHHPHILMKRITGVEWGELIDDEDAVRERFGVGDTFAWNLGILVTVCNAVHCAHSEGVLHRDLKPENVMIGEFGEVYVLDWGIAYAIADGHPGRMAGTPRYMAPEMVRGEQYGPPTDVYLLGALLHRILTGAPPHRGTTIDAILAGIQVFEPTYDDDLPAPLVALARDALSLDPARRPATAELFRMRLASYLERRGAMALCQRAEARWVLLQSELDGPADPKQVYEHLAACRFGFNSALEAWPENEAAREGLTRALSAVVRYEIAQRDPWAARALIASLPEPDPALEADLVALEVSKAEASATVLRLTRNADLRIGARTRFLLVALIGGSWVLITVVGHFLSVPATAEIQVITAMATLLTTSSFCVWARESLLATTTNRSTAALLIATPATQAAMIGLLALHGANTTLLLVMDDFLFGVLTIASAIVLDARMVGGAIAFFAAALGASLAPAYALLFTAAALAVFTGNLLWIWAPQAKAGPYLADEPHP